MNGFCEHAQELNALPCRNADKVKHTIQQVALKNVASHMFSWRHVFERCLGENLTRHGGLSQFPEETILDMGIDLKSMAKS